MSNILEQLKREGSVALWHDYRLGHANDLSGNGNDGTLINDPWFDRNGLNTTYLGNEAVQVAHDASFSLGTFTAVALMRTNRITQRASIPTLVNKEDAGGSAWTIILTETEPAASNRINLAGAVWVPSRSLDGFRCVGCNADSGNTSTSCYLDGTVTDSALNVGPPITTNTADLTIGNRYTLNRGFGRTLSTFIIFNKQLSATEHAQVYGQLMKTRLGIIS